MKRLTIIEFSERANHKYGASYEYSKVHFVNTSTKVYITCPEHGDFWMTPNNFLNGHKCPACSLDQVCLPTYIRSSFKNQIMIKVIIIIVILCLSYH